MNNIFFIIMLAVLLSPGDVFPAQIGELAPSFKVTDLSNKIVALNDLKEKIALLTFWAPWCVPCKDELPEFERLYKKYRDKGFVVIGISVETSASGVSSFLRKAPVTFPVVIDGNGRIAESYRVTGLPASFLVDKTGTVRKRYWGFEKSSLSNYETDINSLLMQQ